MIDQLRVELWNRFTMIFYYEFFHTAEEAMSFYEKALSTFSTYSDSIELQKYAEPYLLQCTDSDSMIQLGMYYFSIGDFEAMKLSYQKAHHPLAYFYLGQYYESIKDEDNMMENYIKSAEFYYLPALNNVGCIYLKKGEEEKAYAYFYHAIQMGDATAMFNMGLLFEKKADKKSATYYYELALTHGNLYAYHKMGQMTGDISYYMNSVLLLNNVSSMISLAKHFEEEDVELAISYWKDAYENGSQEARKRLLVLYQKKGMKDLSSLTEDEIALLEEESEWETNQTILCNYYLKTDDWKKDEKKINIIQMSNSKEAELALAEYALLQSPKERKKYLNTLEKAALFHGHVNSLLFLMNYYAEKYCETKEETFPPMIRCAEKVITHARISLADKCNAHILLGKHYFNMNNLSEMIDEYERAIKLGDVGKVKGSYKLGIYYYMIDQSELAMKYLTLASEKDPENSNIYILLACAYHELPHDTTDTKKRQIYINNIFIYLKKAFDKGNVNASILLAQFYITLFSNSPTKDTSVENYIQKQKNYLESAELYLSKAFDKDNVNACVYLSHCKKLMGNHEDAEKYISWGIETLAYSLKKKPSRKYTKSSIFLNFDINMFHDKDDIIIDYNSNEKYEMLLINKIEYLKKKKEYQDIIIYLKHGCNVNNLEFLKKLHNRNEILKLHSKIILK